MNLTIDPAVFWRAYEFADAACLARLTELSKHPEGFRLYLDYDGESSALWDEYYRFIRQHPDHAAAKLASVLLLDGVPDPKEDRKLPLLRSGVKPDTEPWLIPAWLEGTPCGRSEALFVRMAAAMQSKPSPGMVLLLPGPQDPHPICTSCTRRPHAPVRPQPPQAGVSTDCLHNTAVKTWAELNVGGLSVQYASDETPVEAWAELGLLGRLDGILPGEKDAGAYQQLMMEILPRIFRGLHDPQKEVPLNHRTGQIDIVLRNSPPDGSFMHDLIHVAKIPCPFVYAECKNSRKHSELREGIRELVDYLDGSPTKLGLLVCRTVANRKTVLENCWGRVRTGKYILVLEDADIRELLLHGASGRMDRVDDRLWGMMHQLMRQAP